MEHTGDDTRKTAQCSTIQGGLSDGALNRQGRQARIERPRRHGRAVERQLSPHRQPPISSRKNCPVKTSDPTKPTGTATTGHDPVERKSGASMLKHGRHDLASHSSQVGVFASTRPDRASMETARITSSGGVLYVDEVAGTGNSEPPHSSLPASESPLVRAGGHSRASNEGSDRSPRQAATTSRSMLNDACATRRHWYDIFAARKDARNLRGSTIDPRTNARVHVGAVSVPGPHGDISTTRLPETYEAMRQLRPPSSLSNQLAPSMEVAMVDLNVQVPYRAMCPA